MSDEFLTCFIVGVNLHGVLFFSLSGRLPWLQIKMKPPSTLILTLKVHVIVTGPSAMTRETPDNMAKIYSVNIH